MGMVFPADTFPSCWIFASYGGWRGYQTLLVEPCTSYPQTLEEAMREGRAQTLGPGAAFQTSIRFIAQEGLRSVSGLAEDGLFQE